MPWFLNWRLWAGVIFLSLLPILYTKGRLDGRELERAETLAAVAQADREARKMEQLRQARVVEAQSLAVARDRALRRDAALARNALDGLRDELDAAERRAEESAAAADQHRTALRELFVQCGKDLQELAAKADGHASDVRLLLDSWPK